jgi:DNA replication protein DnaC
MNRLYRAYAAAEEISDCIGCAGGKVPVILDDGHREEYLIPCPMLNAECRHGQELLERLDKHAFNGVFSVIGLPAIFRDRLASPQSTAAVRGASQWVNNLGTFLVLHGEHGTGKSFAAAYALYLLFRKNMLRNWKYPMAWTALRAMWLSAYRATARDEFFEAARVAPLLVLDDLGSEESTQRAKKRIADIVSERYNQKLPTVLTMNEDALKLADMYDRRTADRVIGAGHSVYCGGESMRLAS